jgi:hypothetical protein
MRNRKDILKFSTQVRNGNISTALSKEVFFKKKSGSVRKYDPL